MSEFKKTRDVSTSKKLQPPRSLQGEDDAESTWDLILTRYPNAAPLLCQMETVIDRAEGLLQQLRSPYTHALERSSSFQIADSEDELMGPCHIEESTEVSMISEQDSRLCSVENMTPEIGSVAGCSLSDQISIEDYQDGKSNLEQICNSVRDDEHSRVLIKPDASSVEEQIWSNDLSSATICERNSNVRPAQELEIEGNLMGQEEEEEESLKSPLSSVVNVTAGQIVESEDPVVAKSLSLEAWGKVVGENGSWIKKSKPVGSRGDSFAAGVTNSKEDSVSDHARRLKNSLKNGPMHQITKINILGKKDELMQRFAGTIATASKVLDTAIIADEKTERVDDPVDKNQGKIDNLETKINERGERTSNQSGNIDKDIEDIDQKTEVSSEFIEKIEETTELNEVQGNGDEAGTGTGPRSPVEILEEYSKICGIPVEYKNLSPNRSFNKNVIVKCCLGGFSFEVCAQAKKIGKREAAGKVLRYLAGRQIDGENMAGLMPFNRKQIREIISLGNGGEHETAVRKLYKICIELDAPEPVYTIHQDSGIVGNRYTAKCGALGITTSGYGIRILVAKRGAADKLLQNYFGNQTSTNQNQL